MLISDGACQVLRNKNCVAREPLEPKQMSRGTNKIMPGHLDNTLYSVLRKVRSHPKLKDTMQPIKRRQQGMLIALVVLACLLASARYASPMTHRECAMILLFLCVIGSPGDSERTRRTRATTMHFWHFWQTKPSGNSKCSHYVKFTLHHHSDRLRSP